jgi:hypothetical protein
MHAHARPDGARRYVCMKTPGYPNCGSMSVKADPLEALVLDLVVESVDDPRLAETLTAQGELDDGLSEMVRRDEDRMEELSRDFYVDALISKEEFLAARRELAARLEERRTKLAKRSGVQMVGSFLGQGPMLRASWHRGSLEWRRSIVGALMERVVILPGTAGRRPFDPNRVEPAWRY